jgi:hypothetical protein
MTLAVQRLSKYPPSNLSEGTRNLSDKMLPLLSHLGLVMTKPSLKILSTFVEYSNESEHKSRQQKLTGIASWENRNELSVMDERLHALVLTALRKSFWSRSGGLICPCLQSERQFQAEGGALEGM